MENKNISDLTELIKQIEANEILLPDFQREFVWRIVKLSATPLRNRPHMVFCSQGTSWGAGSTHGTSVGCNPLAYP